MEYLEVDIFDLHEDGNTICITTNGYVKTNGEAVMGRGVARIAAAWWPRLPAILGYLNNVGGNNVYPLTSRIISFPVKPVSVVYNGKNIVPHMMNRFKVGDVVPGWAALADIDLIKKSLHQLGELAYALNVKPVYLPKPGCGAGKLKWEDVRKECEKCGNWLVVVDKP